VGKQGRRANKAGGQTRQAGKQGRRANKAGKQTRQAGKHGRQANMAGRLVSIDVPTLAANSFAAATNRTDKAKQGRLAWH
jgi:hypothetical protein